MQVFGLPGQIIKTCPVRLSKTAGRRRVFSRRRPPISKPREDATRWRDGGGRADGLNAEQAARAVGVPRSTLYRWGKDAAPRNRRPRRVRPKTWTPALRQAAERLRQDFPMWGGAKIGPLLRAEGFEVSDATVGRMLAELVARGVVQAVPTLRRRPHARRWTAKRRFARRLPRGLAVTEPGGSSSSTPSSSISPPPKRSSTSPPMIRSPNGPSAKFQPRLRTSRCSLPR
jgi:putative transposase